MSETKQYIEGYFPQIQELARHLGVDTDWWDFSGQYHQVNQLTLLKVLDALGYPIYEPADIDRAFESFDKDYWLAVLPQGWVVRQSTGADIPVHIPDGTQLEVHLETESGDIIPLQQTDKWVNPRDYGDRRIGEATFWLPANTPLGYHTIKARTVEGEFSAEIAVVPDCLTSDVLKDRRAWGVMAQLYSVTSRESWGTGDFEDLSSLVRTFGKFGADFLLTNPLHASEPNPPISPSPYLPVSRRFLNPLYIRPENIPEYHELGQEDMAKSKVAFAQATNDIGVTDREKQIDRDRSWRAKRKSLELIYRVPRSSVREQAFQDFKTESGQILQDFALWCAIYDHFGPAPWPDDLKDIHSARIPQLRLELAEDVEFHCWLQWVTRTQLREAQSVAKQSGMQIGIMNDLAVGVHRCGAASWTLPEAYVTSMSVGAPPDMYNQLGQDWSQPPLNPRYMQCHGWEPLRGIIRSALRDCGALRIDHLMGLLRLWWIPQGAKPNEGTYVRYNHEATVGILLLEATRAGAILIGEDLGTVEDWVRDYMVSRGIFGTSVLWFEKNPDNTFRQPDQYREMCMAAVNTHDLPPTLGYLRAYHLEVQDKLGILPVSLEEAKRDLAADIASVTRVLYDLGLVESQTPTEWELILGLHRFICASPAKLNVISLVDAVGDIRMQNQPGTNNEFPGAPAENRRTRILRGCKRDLPVRQGSLAERPAKRQTPWVNPLGVGGKRTSVPQRYGCDLKRVPSRTHI